jgi:hypothetical protein
VFGIPEDLGDKKLAELFTPFGTVSYAKVGVEKETGRNRTYGMSLSFPSLVLISYPHIPCWRFLVFCGEPNVFRSLVLNSNFSLILY